jgi:glycolate oxidase FAD binding subunit
MELPTACRIDDFGPLPVLQTESVAEVGDAVRRAAAKGQAVYPFGGQTMLDLGLPPTKPGVALDLRGLDQVIDYPARDMTITVQAGITLARLQELLHTENQRLPIDVPQPDRATLGGALAVNVSGPRRYGFGTLRDYVIGITVVNDEGHKVKAGGRVVKNVAGYDLCKLYVGSLGTLGVITQVTLKLRPRPEQQALIAVGCGGDAVAPLLDQLHVTRTRPCCLDLLNEAAVRYINPQTAGALPAAPWVVVIGSEDNRQAVDWQVQQLLQEIPPTVVQGLNVHGDRAAEPLWHALVELRLYPEARLSFKANLLPHATAAFCRQAAARPEGLLLQAHAGNGIVVGHAGDLTLEQARTLLAELQRTAGEAQGNVVVLRCPSEWKPSLPLWGGPRGDRRLMRAVKEKLDPRGLFNPGRFVDGI